MIRKWFLILLSVLLIFALAACTKAETQTTPVEQPPEATEVPEAVDTDHDDDEGDSADDSDASHDDDADADQADEEDVSVDAAGLYAENCARCHGADRAGGGGPSLLPERLTGDPASYKTTIIEGSGPMPSFGDKFSAE